MSSPFEPAGESAYYDPANDLPLADPSTRLGAKIMDGLIGVLPLLPAFAATVAYEIIVGPLPEDPPPVIVAVTLVCMLGMLAVAIYQWVQIATTGQSIGKRMSGIKIVKVDGSPVDFVSGVLVRAWVFNFGVGILTYCCVGYLLSLVDSLMIFSDGHRCLHDRLAGTKVVVAPR